MEPEHQSRGTSTIAVEGPNFVVVGSDIQGTYENLGLKVNAYKTKTYEFPKFKAGIASAGVSSIQGVYDGLQNAIDRLTNKEFRKKFIKEQYLLSNKEPPKEDTEMLSLDDILPADFVRYLRSSVYNEQTRFQDLIYGAGTVAPRKEIVPMEFVVGTVDEKGKTTLNRLFGNDLYGKERNYIAGGSGLIAAEHILENGWKKNMTVEESVDLVVDAIQAATDQTAYVGKGIILEILEPKRISHLEQYLKPAKFDKKALKTAYARKVAPKQKS